MIRYSLSFFACVAFLALVSFENGANAQEMHRIHTSGLPLGEVGQTRLAQGGPVHGYYQPVQFFGPEGVTVSLANDARFQPAQALPSKVGLLLGQVYRMRLTGIPFHADQAVFPTVELIDRTYPPFGEALDFPIVVEFTLEDIESALSGKYVTKIVYLENPYLASPIRTEPDSPLNWDVQPGADPLTVANTMGRPVAIVRIGGRAPGDSKASDPSFFLGCPPWIGVDRNEEGQVLLTYNSNRFPTVPAALMPPQRIPAPAVPTQGPTPEPAQYLAMPMPVRHSMQHAIATQHAPPSPYMNHPYPMPSPYPAMSGPMNGGNTVPTATPIRPIPGVPVHAVPQIAQPIQNGHGSYR